MRGFCRPIGLVAALAVVAASPAAARGLAVNTGLWQTTSTTSGTPAGSARTLTRKMCVTQAMLDKAFSGPDAGEQCARTVVTSSASVLEVQLACNGEHPATGTFRLEAADAQTVNGVFDMMLTTRDGQTLPMHRTLQAHWLAADCGDVKPLE